MKRIYSVVVVGGIVGASLLLSGCMETISPVSEDEQFEEEHAQEMENVAEQANNNDASVTVDLLMPENPVEIVTETVEYTAGTQGFLAYPEGNPQAPGIVVIHERRGLNEHIEDMARVLAMNGYRALAVDLYKGVVAEDSEQARTLSSGLDATQATENLLAAENYLRETANTVVSLGWCMGGAQSLRLSLASETLDGTIIYYGRLIDDPEQLASINQPVLGIFAENDGGIPPSAVESFVGGLVDAGVEDVDITIYPDTDHAFANPTGGNYNQEATIDAWNKTLRFLENIAGN